MGPVGGAGVTQGTGLTLLLLLLPMKNLELGQVGCNDSRCYWWIWSSNSTPEGSITATKTIQLVNHLMEMQHSVQLMAVSGTFSGTLPIHLLWISNI